MRIAFVPVLAVVAMALVGCESTSGNSAANRTELSTSGKTALDQMIAKDPQLQDQINSSYGYVIFPEVGKAAAVVGAAGGKGTVYQNGQEIGTVSMDQVGVGLQLGGETYSELIIFQHQEAFNRLVNNSLEFGGDTSAIAVKAGAAAGSEFANGVKVFIMPKGGLLAGADVHGQRFTFHANNSPTTGPS